MTLSAIGKNLSIFKRTLSGETSIQFASFFGGSDEQRAYDYSL